MANIMFDIVLTKMLTNTLKISEYNQLVFIISVMTFIKGITSLGIYSSITRLASDLRVKDELLETKRIASTSFLLIQFFFIILFFPILGLLIFLLAASQAQLILLVFPLIFLFILFSHFSNWAINMSRGLRKGAVFGVLHVLLTAMPCVLLLAAITIGAEINVYQIIILYVFSQLLTTLLAFFLSRRYFPTCGGFDWHTGRDILSFSLPMLIGSYTLISFNMGIILLLEMSQNSKTELAFFSIAGKVAFLLIFFDAALFMAYTPMIYRKSSEGREELSRFADKSFRLGIICALVMATIAILFANQLIVVFSSKDYSPAELPAKILVIAIVLRIAFRLMGFGPGVEKRTSFYSVFTFSAAIPSMLFSIVLIPEFGAVGASIAILTFEVIQFSLAFIATLRLSHIKFRKGRTIRLAIVSMFFLVVLAILPPLDIVKAMIVGLATILSIIAMALIINVITLQELSYMIAWRKPSRTRQELKRTEKGQ